MEYPPGMNLPPTARDFGDDNSDWYRSGQFTVRPTTNGTIRFDFAAPMNYFELDFYGALHLEKRLHELREALLAGGFVAQQHTPTDNFPWGRFGLGPPA